MIFFFYVQGIFEPPPPHLWLRCQTVKVMYCINYRETAPLRGKLLGWERRWLGSLSDLRQPCGAAGTSPCWVTLEQSDLLRREHSGQALRRGGHSVVRHAAPVVAERPGWAGGCNRFVCPSLFIPLIIRFTFPFLPLDPAVTMGTMFTVAFHWLLERLLLPFSPACFLFSSLGTELWLPEDGEACEASDNRDEGSG